MSAVEKLSDGFEWTVEPWGRGLRSAPLARIADHVFTTCDLALGSDDGEWGAVARAIGAERLLRLRQVHGAEAVVVRRGDRADAHTGRPEADILVSDDPRVAIAVQAADCVPLLIADRVSGAVAAAHAGWRGLAARVPHHAVGALGSAFGARPGDLVAAMGPSIGPCCYEVGPEIDEAFAATGFGADRRQRWFARGRGDRMMLDVWTSAVDQLLDAGVPIGHISVARLCTVDRADLFPSYRRDGPRAGRLAGAIRAARGITDAAR